MTVFICSAYASDLARRVELAREMQELRPAKAQVQRAIDRYVEHLPAATREADRMALQKTLNYKALEKISVDAYAQIFTAEELTAMIAYYAKPEARAAEGKAGDYAAIVTPQIMRLMDQALIRAKISGTP